METQHALIKIKALLDEIKYNLKVDIQRDFVYSQTQQQNVIESLLRNNSLGELKMWIVGNTYDVIDGKQRITAIRRFIINMFELTTKEVWTSLSPQMQEKILDTNIAIAIQSGTFDEKVKSFKLTNTAEKVHPFEELYALYNKSWLTELKYIGETNSAFSKVFGSYERGNNIMRLLKIHNLLDPNGMLRENAIIDFAEFWRNLSYYIDKTLFLFGKYPYDMTVLYELVINNKERAEKLEPDIPKLLLNKKNGVFKLNEDSLDTYYGNILGIYLPKDSRRLFTPSQKEKLFEDEKFRDGTPSDRSFDEYETNHIIRWDDGGRTTISNGELVLPIENKTICNNT